MLKKIAYSKEPILKVHRYVVAVMTREESCVHTKYHYCLNLKEVKAVANKMKKGSWCEVHRANHNFIQAYAQE